MFSNAARGIILISLITTSLVPSIRVSAQSAASLSLDPNNGTPPSASGSLSGDGWCTPTRSVQVSGPGVSGSASVGRTGHLDGSFSVSGSTGDVITIDVFANCGDNASTGRANFTFNSPRPTSPPTRRPDPTHTNVPPPPTSVPLPTATATATSMPTVTASATANPPTATTPPTQAPELVQTDAPGTLQINGCSPQPSEVSLIFLPLTLASPGEDGFGQPDGPETVVQVRDGGEAGLFKFDLPPAELGRLYLVTTEVDSPDCGPNSDPPTQSWTPGSSLAISNFLPGMTELWTSSKGGVPPGQSGEFTGEWVKQYGFYHPNKFSGHEQVFKWSTDLSNADGGKLQASIFPFSGYNASGDVFHPPGLVAEWDITCVNCQFNVDLSILSPHAQTSSIANSPLKPANLFQQLGALLKKLANDALQVVTDWLNLPSPHPDIPGYGTPLAPSVPSDSLVLIPMASDTHLLLPTEFYFRVVPVHGTQLAGALSDTDKLAWLGESVVGELAPSCDTHPSDPNCVGSSLSDLYQVDVLSYHGWIPPVEGHINCYLATKETTVGEPPFPTFTYGKDHQFCPDKEPKSKGIIEAIVDAVADVVNFVSGFYSDFKSALVSAVADLIPGDIPDEDMLTALLDVALASAGIPPSLPNFDALVNDGIDYLASQVAEQAGISPELLQQLSDQGIPADQLNDVAKDFIKDQVKEGIQEGIEAGQYALGNSVGHVPDGVPVIPDPQGSWQQPTMMLRITRTQAHPESEGVCPSKLFIHSQITAQQTDAMSVWNAQLNPASGPPVQVGKTYPLFLDEYVELPVLKTPGDSMDIPLVLTPALKYGVGGGWNEYQDASGAWSVIYHSSDAVVELKSSCSEEVGFQWSADGTFSK